jgi:hypothetical protein
LGGSAIFGVAVARTERPVALGRERNKLSSKRVDQPSSSIDAYQLEITLSQSKPAIWRRLRVLGDTSLDSLHLVIQHAMGWTNSHLYRFELGDRRFSEPDPDDCSDEPAEDARRIRLRDLGLRQGSEFSYVYDFGDWWEHRVMVEAVFAPLAEESYPCCIGGERAGPLEDVGGVHGYAEFLSALRNPRHPEHAQWSEWVPDAFEPDAFDAAETTELLQHFHGKKRRRDRR